jgi:hypothetical protein
LIGNPDMCAPQTAIQGLANWKSRRWPLPTGRSHAAALNRRGDRSTESIAPACRQQRHATRPPVRTLARWNRDAAHIEQVHEIGVGAEHRVRPDRVGGDLLEGHESREGRHAEGVDLGKLVEAGALQLPEPVLAAECIDGRQ